MRGGGGKLFSRQSTRCVAFCGGFVCFLFIYIFIVSSRATAQETIAAVDSSSYDGFIGWATLVICAHLVFNMHILFEMSTCVFV